MFLNEKSWKIANDSLIFLLSSKELQYFFLIGDKQFLQLNSNSVACVIKHFSSFTLFVKPLILFLRKDLLLADFDCCNVIEPF